MSFKISVARASVWAFVLGGLTSARAHAQASNPTRSGDATALPSQSVVPPELVAWVSVEYPPQALRERIEGVVVLRLDIDAAGSVTDAEVVESAGAELDAAARAAVLQFSFDPARRSDVAVASRILYRYEFHLPAEVTRADAPARQTGPVAAAPVAPPPAALEDKSPRPVEMTGPSAESATTSTEDVTVEGMSSAERKRQSAEAVTVVETELVKRRSADTGEVLARVQGIGVRREGGLGSSTRFSVNGLIDDQVRFFLDGVPLELAGYTNGVSSVPLNLVSRFEIYSGVLPVRFGADALGGGVNLTSNDEREGTHASASYQAGSFDTHRVTATAQHLDEASGLFAKIETFYDTTLNNYPIDVEVPDSRGRLSPARVYRFHDGYDAKGVIVEAGVVRRPWARRLAWRAFISNYEKELQHNAVMTVPYGGVSYGELTLGTSVRYQQPLGRGLLFDALAGYTYTRGQFLDVATCVYDWFGRCVNERLRPGETDARPHDQVYWDKTGFMRTHASWFIDRQHALRFVAAPTLVSRSGDERRQTDPDARDALSAQRRLVTLVNGIEYESDWFDDTLENIVFVKQYLQWQASEESRPGNIFRRRDRSTHRPGYGDELRYHLTSWSYLKASYEWATRLPRAEEVFGDGAFVVANLELEPELSHNANLGCTVNPRGERLGRVQASINGFVRDAAQQIVLLGSDRVQSYQNVYGARSLGVEGSVEWTSLKDYVTLGLNATQLEFRNTSSSGTFGDFDGDRIPNRPYLFGNAWTRFALSSVFAPNDVVAWNWNSRYVHEFYRGWQSVGLLEFKQVVDAQVVHSTGLEYYVQSQGRSLSSTIEVENVTDEAAYDFFGVQRPARAFYAKATVEF